MSDQQPTVTKHEVAHEMHQRGGNFIHMLALAWYAADDDNRYLIETMWGPEWRRYAVMAQRRKETRHDR